MIKSMFKGFIIAWYTFDEQRIVSMFLLKSSYTVVYVHFISFIKSSFLYLKCGEGI